MQQKRLTKQENDFLNLFYIYDMTVQQVAEKTNMHPRFVEKNKKTILKKLETN